MKRTFLFLAALILTYSSLFGQDENAQSSEDILINYYANGFEPYKSGVWYLAMAMSLNDQNLRNSTLGLFDDVIEGRDGNWSLDLTTGRYISDYFLVGLSLGYEEVHFNGTLNGSLGIPFERDRKDQLFTIGSFIRTSIPLTSNKRLSFFNDLGFGLSFGESTIDETRSGVKQTTTKDLFKLGVGINPGITYFAVNNFAFEAGVNLIGYNYSREKGKDSNGEDSFRESHNVNFSVNLLSISMGVAYFFGTKRN